MRGIQITQFGGPEVLQLTTFETPVPGKAEVLIQVAASGINRPDISQRLGSYPPPAGANPLPGLEVAGTIIGGDIDAMTKAGFKIGSEVCALVAGGGYAEQCVAPVAQCLPKPKTLSMIEAAALPENFFTVWTNVFQRGQLKAGEYLLIQGGSSGIGLTAIMLAKLFGAYSIVTAGSERKCAACLSHGAQHAINYNTQDFEQEVLEITHQKGVDVVLDMVAGSYVQRELNCMTEEGRLLLIAGLGGQSSQIDTGLIMRKRLVITGSTLRPQSIMFKGQIAKELLDHVWPFLEDSTIKPIIDQVYAPQNIIEAHQRMESSQHIGKLVIDWTFDA